MEPDKSANVDPGSGQPPPSLPPPRGPSLGVIFVVLVVGLLMLAAGVKWSGPINAVLSPSPATTMPATAPTAHTYYTCGMDPQVLLPKPGPCPICHMPLVPIDPSKFADKLGISPLMTQNIGVRIAPVVTGPLTKVIRTVGSVEYNETLVRDVNLKIGGWVEKLYVDYVGKPVEKGQPLLDIYSPELYSAQEEYLNAYRAKGADGRPATAPSDIRSWDKDLLDAARKRLENFDISAEQIRQLEVAGKVSKTMALRSPYQGLVVAKSVNEGQKVDAGTQLLRIADLSNVWIMVTLYEYQLPFVQVGQQAVVTLPYVPGSTFEGKVAYIYPYLNPENRQVKVRIDLANPDLALKPGMFANVELHSTLAKDRILVPREAVVDTGTRQRAFVSLGEGKFEPRIVRVGAEAENGMIEILDGLKPGELVVTSGSFLLDSEANTREALAKMVKGEQAGEQPAQAAVAGASELPSLPEAMSKGLGAVLDSYFAIGDKLADDTLDGTSESARKIAAEIDALVKIEVPADIHFWHKHTEAADVRGKALALAGERDIAKARETFADLTIALTKLVKATGVPATYGKEVQELHCPMYREGQGGTWWLQPAGKTRNPYFGKSMLECKDKQNALPVTGKAGTRE